MPMPSVLMLRPCVASRSSCGAAATTLLHAPSCGSSKLSSASSCSNSRSGTCHPRHGRGSTREQGVVVVGESPVLLLLPLVVVVVGVVGAVVVGSSATLAGDQWQPTMTQMMSMMTFQTQKQSSLHCRLLWTLCTAGATATQEGTAAAKQQQRLGAGSNRRAGRQQVVVAAATVASSGVSRVVMLLRQSSAQSSACHPSQQHQQQRP